MQEHSEGEDVYNSYLYDNLFDREINLEGISRVASWLMPLLLVLFGLKFGVSIKLLLVQFFVLVLAAFSWIGVVFWSDKLLWPAYISAFCLLTLFCIVLVEAFVTIRALRITKLTS